MDIKKIQLLAEKAGLTQEKFTKGMVEAVRSSLDDIKRQSGSNKVAFIIRPVAIDMGFIECEPCSYIKGPENWFKNPLPVIPFEQAFIPSSILNNNLLKMGVKAATGKSLEQALESIREYTHALLIKNSSYCIITEGSGDVHVGFFALENGRGLEQKNIEDFAIQVYNMFTNSIKGQY